ncbi:unnamed protein product [Rhizoctonia solani]|uniref:Uncharacterized protein n=1 Tax=Rhizoctonia solani TaxID=456999 RepID=A0A8H2X5Z0_9AGAM|nr:unnamed protein product [Rhizoctonia solani]
MPDSSCTRILRIPELLGLVYRYATPRTRGSLLQVSHSFFNIGAPIAWESVEGVQKLLKVIPGVFVNISEKPRHDWGYEITITLPPILNFARFDLYARHIRRLEIYPRNSSDSITLKNWSMLSAHSRTHGLLPNLSQLTLTTYFGWADESELFIWIRTFMSPSLTSLHITVKSESVLHQVSFPVARALLRHAVSNCPDLHELSLVTSEQYKGKTLGNLALALAFWEPSYYESLLSLPLRELSCSTSLLLPANIHTLNELGSLERLKLHGGSRPLDHTILWSGCKVLPQLSSLALVMVHWSDVIGILEMDIYSGVKSLIIRIADPDDIEIEPDLIDDPLITRLMVLIARCCPALTDLEVDCGSDYFFSPTDASAFEALTGLALHTVALVNMSLPLAMLENLVLFFPSASTIKVPDFSLKLSELHYFARLPKLVHLAIGLDASPPREPFPHQVDPMTEVAPDFQLLEIDASPADLTVDLSPLSRYLLSIWPNLDQVAWTQGRAPGDEDYQRNIIIANALNALVSTYRSISSTRQCGGGLV